MKKASLWGAFFVGAVWLAPAQAFCTAPQNLSRATVQQVVDGDTVRLKDGRSVRLIGINAPEIGRKGRTDEPFAVAARRRLQALVDASGGQVGLQAGIERQDHYGRTLAYLYSADGRSLDAQLLAEGLGYQVVVAPNLANLQCQQQAERSARQAGAGLWKQFSAQPAEGLARPGFAVVVGRVEKISRNGAGIWIDLEGDLVLRVAKRDQPAFASAQLDAWQGRRVEVRGWVVDRARRSARSKGQARWMMSLSHPAMIQRLP